MHEPEAKIHKKTKMISRTKVLFILALTLHMPSGVVCQQQDRCKVCGTLGPDVIPLPRKLLPPGLPLPLTNCFDLDSASLLLESSSDLCRAAQSFGTYCGCDKATNACNLCWDGSPVTRKEHATNYDASDFLGEIGVGYKLTCEVLEAFLHSDSNSTDVCLRAQTAVGEECGCPPLPAGNDAGDNDTATDSTLQPNPGTGADENRNDAASENMCTLCPNGEPVPFPDKLVVIQRDLTLTCSEWAAIAATSEEGSDDCQLVQSAGVLCGCSRPEGGCNM